ncbi:acetyl-CoA synthetase-like protein [Lepidopterella palustris CBS 459.81]|uniref:Acetyl-CoA synthetase-like protein n=1 Tax=Lepidopterella palustris CBS 459.81 TaxID=1314670 RepID=A0A8E2JH22_9PEZI|nr:acetyl-CoA synthetase-like protein [Lepidopterella palustris CBS 459.81]
MNSNSKLSMEEFSSLDIARTTDFVSWTFSSQAEDLNKPIIIDTSNPSRHISYNEAHSYVRKLVIGFKALGIRPSDCICLNGFNDIFYHILILGIIGAGARFTGINPSYTTYEVSHHIQLTKPSLLIIEPPMLSTTLAALVTHPHPRPQILLFDEHEPTTHPSYPSWRTLLTHLGESAFHFVPSPSTTTAAYLTTSGTSGLPKAALITHSYLISQSAIHCPRSSTNLPYTPLRLTAGPPFHAFNLPLVPASLHAGIPIYILRRYTAPAFLAALSRFQISETYVPPPVLTALPRSPLCSHDAVRSLRQIWVGGAAAPMAARRALYEVLAEDARINIVWGLTEVGWATASMWPGEVLRDDSVGRALPGFSVKAAPEEMETRNGAAKAGEAVRGELLIRAPFPMLGYLGQEEETREAFDPEGYFKTGDVGYVEEDGLGNVWVVDRKKDLIKVRGWQVSPSEVEAALRCHENILDIVVVAVGPTADGAGVGAGTGTGAGAGGAVWETSNRYDEGVAEVPRAYIVRQPGRRLTEGDVKAFAKTMLARYKIPEQVVFVDEIPRSSTGKILRNEIRRWESTYCHHGDMGKEGWVRVSGDLGGFGGWGWCLRVWRIVCWLAFEGLD